MLMCHCHRSVPSLVKLSLQSNRLTSMAGLQSCTALQELYLSHNGIDAIEVRRPGFWLIAAGAAASERAGISSGLWLETV